MTIADIQRRLAELGFDPGPIDGRTGPKTRAAIRAAQRWHGLKDDGIAGAKTMAALWPDRMPERDNAPPEKTCAAPGSIWPRQKGVASFFGEVGKHQVMLELPFTMRLAWDKRVAVRRFSIHEKVHDSARRCFERIADAYHPTERIDLGIDLFGGCLNVRKMRGGNSWSMHSWGIAIDFDPARNQLKWGRDKARLARADAEAFWRIWEDEGWLGLGRARNYDWMHIQAANL